MPPCAVELRLDSPGYACGSRDSAGDSQAPGIKGARDLAGIRPPVTWCSPAWTSIPSARGSPFSIDTTNIYAEINLKMKTAAMALCDVAEPDSGRHWKEDKDLMAFLNSY